MQLYVERMSKFNLKLICTTDLHMELFGYDYLSDTEIENRGLLKLIPQIRQERRGQNAILFDNGDFLQGTPLADELIQSDNHYLATIFNDLSYDAITLGNHDFDYGLDALSAFLAKLEIPVVSANVSKFSDDVVPSLILDRTFYDLDGFESTIRIGVLGLLPPQTTHWNAHSLRGDVEFHDIVKTAEAEAQNLKNQGADIVVALAHTGLDQNPPKDMMENAIEPLSHLDNLDLIVGGHTHEWFSSEGNETSSRLGPVPVIQAGSHGQGFGVVEMTLAPGPKWRVTCARSRLVKTKANTVPVGLPAGVSSAHQEVRHRLAEPIGRSSRPLSNHFSSIGFDDGVKLVHQALLDCVDDALPNLGMPKSACFTSFRSDGVFGSKNFLNTEDLVIRQRDLESVVPFNNPICAIESTALQLRTWIAKSSEFFNSVDPVSASTPLRNKSIPAYFFDQFSDVTYEIDLSKDTARPKERVPQLRLDGRDLDDDEPIAIIATTYRAYGGGGFVFTKQNQTIWESQQGIRDIVAQYLSKIGSFEPDGDPLWTFTSTPGAKVTFALPQPCASTPSLEGLAIVNENDKEQYFELEL